MKKYRLLTYGFRRKGNLLSEKVTLFSNIEAMYSKPKYCTTGQDVLAVLLDNPEKDGFERYQLNEILNQIFEEKNEAYYATLSMACVIASENPEAVVMQGDFTKEDIAVAIENAEELLDTAVDWPITFQLEKLWERCLNMVEGNEYRALYLLHKLYAGAHDVEFTNFLLREVDPDALNDFWAKKGKLDLTPPFHTEDELKEILDNMYKNSEMYIDGSMVYFKCEK